MFSHPVAPLRLRPLARCIAAAVAVIPLAGPVPTHVTAQPFAAAVTTCDDSGAGSLRAALAVAAEGDTIDLTGLACSTISLTTGALEIEAAALSILGPGADDLAIDAGGAGRAIADAVANGQLTIRGLSIRNGAAEGNGGCIDMAGSLMLNDVVVEGCTAHASGEVRGGGVHAGGLLVMDHSRISGNAVRSDTRDALGGGAEAELGAIVRFSSLSGNTARSLQTPYEGSGGGLMVETGSSILGSTFEGNSADRGGAMMLTAATNDGSDLAESTVSGNTATKVGGIASKARLSVRHSTIAFNCSSVTQTQKYALGTGINGPIGQIMSIGGSIVANNAACAGSVDTAYDIGGFGTGVSGDHDLIRSVPAAISLPGDTLAVDPLLAPLDDNGGPTRTHALLADSRAIDAGGDDLDHGFDQRGDGYAITGAMTSASDAGPRDPRRAGWSARIVGAHSDIGAFERQSIGAAHGVTRCDDDGEGTLRAAVAAAASGDRIDLTQSGCTVIALETPITVGVGNLEIIGPGADRLTLQPADPVARPHRLIAHTGAGILSVTGITFADGHDAPTDATQAQGGCIASRSFVSGSDVAFLRCAASTATSACFGGAVVASGVEFHDASFDESTCTSANGQVEGGTLYAALVTLADAHVSRGAATQPTAAAEAVDGLVGGGAGCIRSTSRARIERTTIDGCASGNAGAGLFASLDLVDSTVSGNHAERSAAGIYADDAVVANSTITANARSASSDTFGDGLRVNAWARLDSSIVHGNGTAAGVDVSAARVTGAHNLIGASSAALPGDTSSADPRLAPLADNGGRSPTHALLAGSPAIEAGSNPLALATDARGTGFARVVGAAADIGAYETQQASVDVIFADGFDRRVQ